MIPPFCTFSEAKSHENARIFDAVIDHVSYGTFPWKNQDGEIKAFFYFKAKLVQWYEDLIGMMRDEDVQEKGHLQINKNVIISLTDLHLQLLRSTKEPFYGAAYYKALPFIVELRNKSGNTEEPELETCFEALYGAMLLKLQKKEISQETGKALEVIAKFLSLLSNYYEKDRNGELKLDD